MFPTMEPELRAHLVAIAAAFCSARGCALSTTGRQAAGDWRFFSNVEAGGNFTIRKYDEVMAWFSGHWPDDLAWPKAIPRPAPGEPVAPVEAVAP